MPNAGWFDELSRRAPSELDFYGRDGQPISFAAWAALFENRAYQTVVVDRVAYPNRNPDVPSARIDIVVSTVWLGMDHSFGGPVPLIFETLVFAPEEFPLESEMLRYPTEDAARRGHADMLARVQSLVNVATSIDDASPS